jgi:hypothetical protein
MLYRLSYAPGTIASIRHCSTNRFKRKIRNTLAHSSALKGRSVATTPYMLQQGRKSESKITVLMPESLQVQLGSQGFGVSAARFFEDPRRLALQPPGD